MWAKKEDKVLSGIYFSNPDSSLMGPEQDQGAGCPPGQNSSGLCSAGLWQGEKTTCGSGASPGERASRRFPSSRSLVPGGLRSTSRKWAGTSREWAGTSREWAGLPLAPADLSLSLNPTRALLGLLLAHYPCSWIPLLLTREPFPMLLARSSAAAVSLPFSLSFPDHTPAGDPSCLSLSSTSSGSPFQGLPQYGIINASVCCLLPR